MLLTTRKSAAMESSFIIIWNHKICYYEVKLITVHAISVFHLIKRYITIINIDISFQYLVIIIIMILIIKSNLGWKKLSNIINNLNYHSIKYTYTNILINTFSLNQHSPVTRREICAWRVYQGLNIGIQNNNYINTYIYMF